MSIGRFLDATTAHIPKVEADRLPDGYDDLYVDAHGHGWWILVPDEEGDQAPEFRAAAPRLAGVLDYARRAGCRWVNLDADGNTIDGLPTYEW